MEFKRAEMIPLHYGAQTREEKFETFFSSFPHERQFEDRTEHSFGLSMEGDTYDGDYMDYAVFEILLTLAEAKEFHRELAQWINEQEEKDPYTYLDYENFKPDDLDPRNRGNS